MAVRGGHKWFSVYHVPDGSYNNNEQPMIEFGTQCERNVHDWSTIQNDGRCYLEVSLYICGSWKIHKLLGYQYSCVFKHRLFILK